MAHYRSTGKELRRSPKGVLAGIFALIIAVGAGYGIYRVESGMLSLRPTLEDLTNSRVDVVIPGSETTAPPKENNYGQKAFQVAGVRSGALMLVSEDFPTVDNTEGLVSVFQEKNEYLSVKDMNVQLRLEAVQALNQLAAGFNKATGHTDLIVMNGYRTTAEQRKLYEADLQRTGNSSSDIYATPGSSEFQTGYAVELAVYGGAALSTEGEHSWVLEHCAEYGFVLRYPLGKEDYTKARDCKMMLRYVGTPHSMYMTKNNLCLEEYVELLEAYPYEGNHLRLTDPLGRPYEAYYCSVDPASTALNVDIPVPLKQRYTISGDNKHGFFVTVELPREETSWTTTSDPVLPEAESEAP